MQVLVITSTADVDLDPRAGCEVDDAVHAMMCRPASGAVEEAPKRPPALSAADQHLNVPGRSLAANQAVTPPPFAAPGLRTSHTPDSAWHEQHKEVRAVKCSQCILAFECHAQIMLSERFQMPYSRAELATSYISVYRRWAQAPSVTAVL